MARITLGLATSHAPTLNRGPESWDGGKRDMTSPMGGGMRMQLDIEAMVKEHESWIHNELTLEVRQRRYDTCSQAILTLGEVLGEAAPDVCVIVGDDTHEVFMPEEHIPAVDVYWGESIPYVPHSSRVSPEQQIERLLPCEPELGRHIVESLNSAEFDVSHSRTVPDGRSIGHAFDFVYGRVMADQVGPQVPIWLNTYYEPNQPTLKRCYALGRALRQAIEGWKSDKTVAVIATGGLSHLILDEELDRSVLAAIQDKDEKRLTSFPEELFTFGTSEIRNWVALAGAMEESDARMTLVAYEPCYRSPAATGCGCGFAYWR